MKYWDIFLALGPAVLAVVLALTLALSCRDETQPNKPQIRTTDWLVKARDGDVVCYRFEGREGVSCIVLPEVKP